jgi:hypothetical protein
MTSQTTTLFRETQDQKMPSLLVIVFVIQLAVRFFNTIGAATLNGLVRDFRRTLAAAIHADKIRHSYGPF